MKNFRFLNSDFVFFILTFTNICSYFAEVEADPIPYFRKSRNFDTRSRKDVDSDQIHPADDQARNIGVKSVSSNLENADDGKNSQFEIANGKSPESGKGNVFFF